MRIMKNSHAALTAGLALMVAGATGCAPTESEDAEDQAAVVEVAGPVTDSAGVIDETVWIGMVPVPGSHLAQAVERLQAGERKASAEELRQVGALLALEASHAEGQHVRERLRGASIEVTEMSSEMGAGSVSQEEFDQVTANALLALAEFHRDQAGTAMHTGRTVLAGRSLAAASREMEMASAQLGLDIESGMRSALDGARAGGERLESDGSAAVVQAADSALALLREDATRLENALGARRM